MTYEFHTINRDEDFAKLYKKLTKPDLVFLASFEMDIHANFLPHSRPIHHAHLPPTLQTHTHSSPRIIINRLKWDVVI